MKNKKSMNFLFGGTGNECIVLYEWSDPDLCSIRQIFPAYSTAQRPPMRNSALVRIQERRAHINPATNMPDANN